ncbi:jg13027 [Pararge aegeria aegeria]|uniref:Jg13027 protein n=1 Tax=Pararge aegeria aegeria TaxID=348720 RepID=A0A8S4RKX7_9NEOP|nr:jg13027 [Pararge aegeria aegeria]
MCSLWGQGGNQSLPKTPTRPEKIIKSQIASAENRTRDLPPQTTALTTVQGRSSKLALDCKLTRLHLSIIGVTDSPLCRACMEKNETPTHVMLECTGVTEQREIYLGSPATIPEILSNLGGMLGFWNELGWLE